MRGTFVMKELMLLVFFDFINLKAYPCGLLNELKTCVNHQAYIFLRFGDFLIVVI